MNKKSQYPHHIELQNTITYKIEYYQNMKLADLITGLQGIENEYKAFCIREAKKSKTKKQIIKFDKVLEIKEINKGSIEFEFINAISPLISDINTLYNFGNLLKEVYDYLIDPTIKNIPEVGKRTLENIGKSIQPIIDIKGNLIINLFSNNNTINILDIDTTKSNAMQNRIHKLSESIEEHEILDETTGVYMYWDTARAFRKEEHTNKDMGRIFIENIDSKKAYQVKFLDEDDYRFCTTKNSNYTKDWQDLMYKVDINIIRKQEKIVAYEVSSVYRDSTLEIDD